MTAPLTLLFANTAGKLYTHPLGYVVLHYHAEVGPVAALASLLTYTGAVLLEHGWEYIVSNMTHLPRLPADARQWVADNWLPGRVPRPAQVSVALVQPTYTDVNLLEMQEQAEAEGLIRYYHFIAEAEAHAFVATRLA